MIIIDALAVLALFGAMLLRACYWLIQVVHTSADPLREVPFLD